MRFIEWILIWSALCFCIMCALLCVCLCVARVIVVFFPIIISIHWMQRRLISYQSVFLIRIQSAVFSSIWNSKCGQMIRQLTENYMNSITQVQYFRFSTQPYSSVHSEWTKVGWRAKKATTTENWKNTAKKRHHTTKIWTIFSEYTSTI